MKFRYILFVLIVFACSGDLFSQTSWNWHNPFPQGNDLHSVVVKADSFGIAVGDAGTSLRRYNGSFQNPLYPVTTNLGGVCYFKDTIWTAGDGGAIFRSVNNGATWTDQSYAASKVNFHGMCDLSKTNLFVVGDSGIILYSTSAGTAWTKQTNSNKNNLNAIANGGQPNMYAVGDGGTILEAINFGSSGYFTIATPHKFSFHGVAMDPYQAFIVGDSSYILQRDIAADVLLSDTILDHGANTFYDVGYANPYVIVVGANGAIRRSTNNGVTWSAPISGATEKLFKIALSGDFASTGIAWVVGESGVFLRTANYGSTWSRLDTGVRGLVYAGAIAPNGDIYATSGVGKTYRLKNGAAHFTLDSLKAGGAPRLLDISFDKTGFGLISTYSTNVLRTVDTGKTWSSSLVDNNANQILGIAMWNSVCLASASNGLVYRSGNKAGTWTSEVTNNTQALYDVDMSGNNAIAAGTNGTVVYSADGGLTWKKPASSGTTAQLNKVRFFTATNAVAISNTGIIIRTTNAGSSWATVSSGVTTPLNDVAFHDDKNGIITGDGGVILKTNDGGKTWAKDQSNTHLDLKGVMIVDGTTAYIAGSKTTILGTTNSGLPVDLISFTGRRLSASAALLNWNVANETDNFGYAVERDFGDTWQQVGFLSGRGTTSLAQTYSLSDINATNDLLHYRLRQIDLDGSEHILGSVSIAPDESVADQQISIYPNPVQSDAKISFSLSSPESVRISIVNELGKEMAVVANQSYQSGSYSLRFDTKQFPSGSYHILFSTPLEKITKEFVVIK